MAFKCPYCHTSANENWKEQFVQEDKAGRWSVDSTICPEPACHLLVIRMRKEVFEAGHGWVQFRDPTLVKPRAIERLLSPVVPDPYAADYREATAVLHDSPKASAALSRRIMQAVIRDLAKVRKGTLYAEIERVIKSKRLPTQLSDALHRVREIGNAAAHPIRSKHTGDLFEVEPGEAEWNLDTIDLLFDFYFVMPAKFAERDRKYSERKSRKAPTHDPMALAVDRYVTKAPKPITPIKTG